MENATKALLIAAAVLVAILIISLGLAVYNMAAETMGNVNLSGQEVEAFNAQFTTYDGQNKRGTEVNALLKTMITNNMNKITEGKSNMLVSTAEGSKVTVSAETTKSVPRGIDTTKLYDITVNFDGPGGLVKTILIVEAGTTPSNNNNNNNQPQ